MKILIVTALILAAATLAPAQSLQDCYNNLGIFNVADPDLDNVYDATNYFGPLGQFTVHVVLINPYNENTDELIRTVGGFEFRVEIPQGLFVTPVLPPDVFNFMEYPDYYCGSSRPVTDNQCLLLSFELGTFIQDPQSLYILPISDVGNQSIPGDLAITDADDEHSLSRATPISGSYEYPVFGVFQYWWGSAPEKNGWDDCWVVPNQATSWGDIKALYR